MMARLGEFLDFVMAKLPPGKEVKLSRKSLAMTSRLQPCPMCHSEARVHLANRKVEILCSKWGCRHVSARSVHEASLMWNEPKRP
jgi:hypothetical protein